MGDLYAPPCTWVTGLQGLATNWTRGIHFAARSNGFPLCQSWSPCVSVRLGHVYKVALFGHRVMWEPWWWRKRHSAKSQSSWANWHCCQPEHLLSIDISFLPFHRDRPGDLSQMDKENCGRVGWEVLSQNTTKYGVVFLYLCWRHVSALTVGHLQATRYIFQDNIHCTLYSGDRGSTVVKVLCYKSECRWFDPSWCQWIFH